MFFPVFVKVPQIELRKSKGRGNKYKGERVLAIVDRVEFYSN